VDVIVNVLIGLEQLATIAIKEKWSLTNANLVVAVRMVIVFELTEGKIVAVYVTLVMKGKNVIRKLNTKYVFNFFLNLFCFKFKRINFFNHLIIVCNKPL
jgi:hypothetical protein